MMGAFRSVYCYRKSETLLSAKVTSLVTFSILFLSLMSGDVPFDGFLLSCGLIHLCKIEINVKALTNISFKRLLLGIFEQMSVLCSLNYSFFLRCKRLCKRFFGERS